MPLSLVSSLDLTSSAIPQGFWSGGVFFKLERVSKNRQLARIYFNLAI
jgi:hypothetical protein